VKSFNSLFFRQKSDRLRGLPGLRGGVIHELPSLTTGDAFSKTKRDGVVNSPSFFRGINSTIEVYIQYTNSLVEVLEFL